MKYEAVFGNQELFDGAGTFTGLDVVVHSIASGIKSYARLSDLTPESLRNHPVCAMRRIIAEPKRWTVADQKAGRLPEVGAKYISNDVEFTCHYIDKSGDVWGHTKNDDVWCRSIGEIIPIETPEEKAQREEDEFISSLKNVEIHAVTASEFFNQVARAAYRKLKGGE